MTDPTDQGPGGGGASSGDGDPFHLRDSAVDAEELVRRAQPILVEGIRPTAPLDDVDTGELLDVVSDAHVSVVPLPLARGIHGPGFVDHRKALDPWNEVTPTELPEEEEDAYLASEVRIVPVDDLRELDLEPLTPSLPISTLSPLKPVAPPPQPTYASDLYDGDGPFASPIDRPRGEGLVRVAELRNLDLQSFDARPTEPRPQPSPRPRAPSIRADIASQLAAPILVERRVSSQPPPDALLTEAEVIAVPRAAPAPAEPTVGVLRSGNTSGAASSALMRTSGPSTPAVDPASTSGAPASRGAAAGEAKRTPFAARPPASTASPSAASGPTPSARGSGGASKAGAPALPPERQYPKMRALLRNPDAVPFGSEEPPKKKAPPPVPGTFFPTPRREARPEVKAAPADLDEMLATMAEGLLIGESPGGGTEVRVTLRDEFFAGTELRIIMGEGRIRAVLHPPDRSTYLTLNGNIDDLRRRLEDRGLQVEAPRVADP